MKRKSVEDIVEDPAKIHAVGWLLIIADALHNFGTPLLYKSSLIPRS